MLKNRWVRAIAVLLAVILVILLWRFVRPAPKVAVVRPERHDVVELVIASGLLRAVRQGDVGPDIGGIVRRVYVQEGDSVVAGQVLLVLDRSDSDERVRQAELAAQTARDQLAQASQPATAQDIAAARAQLSQARQVNAARLSSAREHLRRMELGGRPEERARADAALAQARSARMQAQLNLQRARTLFAKGAIPRSDLDQAQTALAQAQAQERSAQQSLALAQRPASPEDIASARADVRAAQATLTTSVQIARENLQNLLNQPRAEDVRVAASRVREAQAAVQAARVEASKGVVTAPFSGIVTARNVDPGKSVVPGQVLISIADMSRTEIYVETDETNLPKLKVGQRTSIIPPAYPNLPFQAVLVKIGPQVNNQRGVVGLRLRPLTLPSYARPDMTADVNIEVARIPNALSLGTSSVIQAAGSPYVLVVKNGTAQKQYVQIQATGEDWVAISGISATTDVVRDATQVVPGQKVRAMEAR